MDKLILSYYNYEITENDIIVKEGFKIKKIIRKIENLAWQNDKCML